MAKKHKKIRLLQVGESDWTTYLVSDNIEFRHLAPADVAAYVQKETDCREQYRLQQEAMAALDDQERNQFLKTETLVAKPIPYSGLLLTDSSYADTIVGLLELFEVYTVFYDQQLLVASSSVREALRRKMAQSVDMSQPAALLVEMEQTLFVGQNGGKFPVSDVQVVPGFQGRISLSGQSYLVLEGEFGEDFRQIAFFRYNLFYHPGRSLEVFLEQVASQGIETQVVVQQFESGSPDRILQEWVFDRDQMGQAMHLSSAHEGSLAISLFAKGSGQLKIGPCHFRDDRKDFGQFLLGGQRFVDKEQQEFMYYFDPQDFKPPLCVYFSGFRTAEGFEGYWMMKNFGAPFLLICDPRLEGGSFYLGTEELEQQVATVIQETLDFLGFDKSQLILSGLSMGTFGASYYGAKLSPHAIVMGKPVLSLGQVALNEKLNRPGGFPTSLDLLYRFTGRMDTAGAEQLDARFWNQFGQGDFSETTVVVAYMKDDDYDGTAFEQLLATTKGKAKRVIGRGWPGRHLDGHGAPERWFLKHYSDLLEMDFGRKRS